jgi:hypothetical protein
MLPTSPLSAEAAPGLSWVGPQPTTTLHGGYGSRLMLWRNAREVGNGTPPPSAPRYAGERETGGPGRRFSGPTDTRGGATHLVGASSSH